jgi:hypothetical protein
MRPHFRSQKTEVRSEKNEILPIPTSALLASRLKGAI